MLPAGKRSVHQPHRNLFLFAIAYIYSAFKGLVYFLSRTILCCGLKVAGTFNLLVVKPRVKKL